MSATNSHPPPPPPPPPPPKTSTTTTNSNANSNVDEDEEIAALRHHRQRILREVDFSDAVRELSVTGLHAALGDVVVGSAVAGYDRYHHRGVNYGNGYHGRAATASQSAFSTSSSSPKKRPSPAAGNFYGRIQSSDSHDSVDSSTSERAGAARLGTPLIDISNLGRVMSGVDGDEEDERDRQQGEEEEEEEGREFEMNRRGKEEGEGLLPPQAVFHRDGEQARLVEMARQRQLSLLQQQQQQLASSRDQGNGAASATKWIEDGFYENYKYLEGLVWGTSPGGDESMTSMTSSEQSKGRLDLQQQQQQQQRQVHDLTNREATSSAAGTQQVYNPYRDDTTKTSAQSTLLSNPQNSHTTSNHSTSSSPRILRFFACIYQPIIKFLRWYIDNWITRLARLDPLPTNYSTPPTYSLRFTTDDVLRSSLFLWMAFGYCARNQSVAASTLVAWLLLGGGIAARVRNRASPPNSGGDAGAAIDAAASREETVVATSAVTSTAVSANRDSADSTTADDAKRTDRADDESERHARVVTRLKSKFPHATDAECRRFYACVKFDEREASARIESFLKWRSECGLYLAVDSNDVDPIHLETRSDGTIDFADFDKQIWDRAASMALSIVSESNQNEVTIRLPQILCSYECNPSSNINNNNNNNNNNHNNNNNNDDDDISPATDNPTKPRCKDGTRILHILPARLDLSLAAAPTYSLAAALYLDALLRRTDAERLTLVCDVRGGRGWANPTPMSTFPFIRSTSSLLGRHYPERLERMILFPMPKAAMWVWGAAQKCLDPNTASKVVVCSEVAEVEEGFLENGVMGLLEGRRRSFFVG